MPDSFLLFINKLIFPFQPINLKNIMTQGYIYGTIYLILKKG